MTEPDVTGGQPDAEPTGTAATGTDGQTDGQPVETAQTTSNGTAQGESFFDYESIKGKPELEAAYKEMQRAFSGKTKDVADLRRKAQQVDAFLSNPVESMRQLAQQHGYQLVQGQPEGQNGEPQSFNSWDDVMAEAKRRVMADLEPVFGELKSIKQQNVEQMLDNAHPDWRTYEDTMIENLQAHPTLANNPDLLYRISVPSEILEARAQKAALAKIQGATQSSSVQGQSTTTQQANKTPTVKSFNDAVAAAKQDLKRRGIAAPAGG